MKKRTEQEIDQQMEEIYNFLQTTEQTDNAITAQNRLRKATTYLTVANDLVAEANYYVNEKSTIDIAEALLRFKDMGIEPSKSMQTEIIKTVSKDEKLRADRAIGLANSCKYEVQSLKHLTKQFFEDYNNNKYHK